MFLPFALSQLEGSRRYVHAIDIHSLMFLKEDWHELVKITLLHRTVTFLYARKAVLCYAHRRPVWYGKHALLSNSLRVYIALLQRRSCVNVGNFQ